MKKRLILLLVCVTLFPLTAFAQDTGFLSGFRQAITRLIGNDEVEWAKRVHSEEHKVDQASGAFQTSFYAITTQSFPQHPICEKGVSQAQCKKRTQVFNHRKGFIQNLLKNNKVLSKYKLFVSQPRDLYGMSDKEMNFLAGFLTQPPSKENFDFYYAPVRVFQPQPGVIVIGLYTSGIESLYLRIDSRQRIVYLHR